LALEWRRIAVPSGRAQAPIVPGQGGTGMPRVLRHSTGRDRQENGKFDLPFPAPGAERKAGAACDISRLRWQSC